MRQVPQGWRLVRLAEVADTALGKMLDRGKPKGLPQVPYLRNMNVQWGHVDTEDISTMELADDERERFAVQDGDLLACEGGDIGRAAIWRGGSGYMAYQKAVHRVRSKGELHLPYLRYLLELYSCNGTLKRFSTGSTIAHLPQQRFRELPIPLPPLHEQRQIVGILEDHLSRLDAADEGLAKGNRRLRAMHKSVLATLIPEADRYPQCWRRVTVADAGKIELGRQRHPDWHVGPNMRPYLRVANVFEDRLDLRDVKEMHWPDGTFERFRLRPGDVLLNEGQSPELIGRPALYRGEGGEIAFTNSILRFQACDQVLPEFALLVFRRHMHTGRFTREARITTNIGHLSAARLKAVEFPIPPLDEQNRLVALAKEQLESIARLRGEIGASRRRSAGLRQALLAAAFSGRPTGRPSELETVEEMARV
ncbi:restriction endonuclease subunit S [Micromonospora cremea]|uniref:Type I restriction enzyme, S subunit n=1 Tax=Micromonospora cremea TaxID=709881 RepID=A0A1N5ZX18_9ACTN|nr:restriction endonuclease subunit S [Micromonospora cremea]SIN26275.1 type I restriction enzyme, S subunit [Micromonospora cremea]